MQILRIGGGTREERLMAATAYCSAGSSLNQPGTGGGASMLHQTGRVLPQPRAGAEATSTGEGEAPTRRASDAKAGGG